MTLTQQLLALISDPTVAYILLTLGLWALAAEFFHPGALVPGVSGAILLILAFVAFGSLPVNWAGVGLIVFAICLFIADTQVAGVALTIGGVIAFILGSLLLFRPFNATSSTPAVNINPVFIALMTLMFLAFFIFVVGAGLRTRRLPVITGITTLLGATGQATTPLTPQGTVLVRSEDWTADAIDGPIQTGERVKVVGIDGIKLRVKKLI